MRRKINLRNIKNHIQKIGAMFIITFILFITFSDVIFFETKRKVITYSSPDPLNNFFEKKILAFCTKPIDGKLFVAFSHSNGGNEELVIGIRRSFLIGGMDVFRGIEVLYSDSQIDYREDAFSRRLITKSKHGIILIHLHIHNIPENVQGIPGTSNFDENLMWVEKPSGFEKVVIEDCEKFITNFYLATTLQKYSIESRSEILATKASTYYNMLILGFIGSVFQHSSKISTESKVSEVPLLYVFHDIHVTPKSYEYFVDSFFNMLKEIGFSYSQEDFQKSKSNVNHFINFIEQNGDAIHKKLGEKNAMIIMLGDYVDGRPHQNIDTDLERNFIKLLLSMSDKLGEKFKMLVGNHELQYLVTGDCAYSPCSRSLSGKNYESLRSDFIMKSKYMAFHVVGHVDEDNILIFLHSQPSSSFLNKLTKILIERGIITENGIDRAKLAELENDINMEFKNFIKAANEAVSKGVASYYDFVEPNRKKDKKMDIFRQKFKFWDLFESPTEDRRIVMQSLLSSLNELDDFLGNRIQVKRKVRMTFITGHTPIENLPHYLPNIPSNQPILYSRNGRVMIGIFDSGAEGWRGSHLSIKRILEEGGDIKESIVLITKRFKHEISKRILGFSRSIDRIAATKIENDLNRGSKRVEVLSEALDNTEKIVDDFSQSQKTLHPARAGSEVGKKIDEKVLPKLKSSAETPSQHNSLEEIKNRVNSLSQVNSHEELNTKLVEIMNDIKKYVQSMGIEEGEKYLKIISEELEDILNLKSEKIREMLLRGEIKIDSVELQEEPLKMLKINFDVKDKGTLSMRIVLDGDSYFTIKEIGIRNNKIVDVLKQSVEQIETNRKVVNSLSEVRKKISTSFGKLKEIFQKIEKIEADYFARLQKKPKLYSIVVTINKLEIGIAIAHYLIEIANALEFTLPMQETLKLLLAVLDAVLFSVEIGIRLYILGFSLSNLGKSLIFGITGGPYGILMFIAIHIVSSFVICLIYYFKNKENVDIWTCFFTKLTFGAACDFKKADYSIQLFRELGNNKKENVEIIKFKERGSSLYIYEKEPYYLRILVENIMMYNTNDCKVNSWYRKVTDHKLSLSYYDILNMRDVRENQRDPYPAPTGIYFNFRQSSVNKAYGETDKYICTPSTIDKNDCKTSYGFIELMPYSSTNQIINILYLTEVYESPLFGKGRDNIEIGRIYLIQTDCLKSGYVCRKLPSNVAISDVDKNQIKNFVCSPEEICIVECGTKYKCSENYECINGFCVSTKHREEEECRRAGKIFIKNKCCEDSKIVLPICDDPICPSADMLTMQQFNERKNDIVRICLKKEFDQLAVIRLRVSGIDCNSIYNHVSCCDSPNSCVFNNVCYRNGEVLDINNKKFVCVNGVWKMFGSCEITFYNFEVNKLILNYKGVCEDIHRRDISWNIAAYCRFGINKDRESYFLTCS